MMRLIDAEALPSVKFHALPYTHITPSDVNAESYKRGWNDAIDAIVDCAPTIDAVPVVRCRECRYAREPNRMDRDERLACEGVLVCCVGFDHVYPSSDDGLIFVDGSGFCSYGERKDGADHA